MAACATCGKYIPADEMTSRRGVLDIMGIGASDDNPLADMARAMGAATQAWKCNACGEWICNACVCQTVTSSGAGQIRHSSCKGDWISDQKGMFRPPR
jgi:hypothetical protein